MQNGGRRVYRRERAPGKWLSYLMLFLSAVLILAGIARGGGGDGVSIAPAPTVTPIPTGEAFDETAETREITLEGHTWYALQLGAFDSEASAREMAAQYRARGAAGYLWHDGRYRVLAAVYPTREDAQIVREQLSFQHSVETYLYLVELPGATLRVSGMRGQLDMLEAAFLHADDLTSVLQRLSVDMDRQEKTVPEALETLRALRAQVGMTALRLRQRFAEPRHGTVQGLIDCFEQYAAFSDALNGEVSAVAFATAVKEQTFGTLERLKRVYGSFGIT